MRRAKKTEHSIVTFTDYSRKSEISLVGGPHPYLWIGPVAPDARSTIHTFGDQLKRSKKNLAKLAREILKALGEKP